MVIRVRLPDDKKTTQNNQYRFHKFEQLAVLDFTSKRKRMSVIMRAPDGKIKVYTKGADNLVEPLFRGYEQGALLQAQPNWGYTLDALARFGDQGLRTLLVGVATRDASWWDGPGAMGEKYQAGMKEVAVEG